MLEGGGLYGAGTSASPLNLPPYPAYDPHVGKDVRYAPRSVREWRRLLSRHGFKILMDCCAGRATKAVQTLKKIMPDSEKNPSARSGAEPYVFTNCYSNASRILREILSVLDYRHLGLVPDGDINEGILGIKRDCEGLRIHPCFPAQWEERRK